MLTARPLALAAVAAAALATPAHAASYAYKGGCGYDTESGPEYVVAGHPVQGDSTTYRGVVYAVTVLYDAASPTTPVSGTVRCILRVNGSPVVTTAPAHGTSLVVAAEPVEFTMTAYDVVDLCQETTYEEQPQVTECFPVDPVQIPPQEVTDVLTGTVCYAYEPAC